MTARILVCGGRHYDDYETLKKSLLSLCWNKGWRQEWDGDNWYPEAVIIHGDARGADKLAQKWAQNHGCKEEPYPANWQKYGNAAGPIRNKQMVSQGKPDIVVAFPGGPGTRHMIKTARQAGLEIVQVEKDGSMTHTPPRRDTCVA